MESICWAVVAKLSLNDVRLPDVMSATGWFRMKSPTVKTHESPPAIHSFNNSVEEPASVMVLGCVASEWLRDVVTFNSTRGQFHQK